jgi:hypothetical protein
VQRPPRAPTLDAPGDEEADGNGRSGRATPAPGPIPAEPAPGRRLPVVALLIALLAVPLGVALAVLRSPRWYPLLDLAQTEMRVRDVSGGHPPLIGLPGRIGTLGDQGSHPGPLSFWALWPFYEVFGATSWALQVASASLHLLAAGTTLWIARRRGGTWLAVGVALALVLLVRAYGPSLITEAWNPYLPVLAWVLFLFAVWSVWCDDLPLLPVAVVAGSFCAQTHISYLGLIGGLAALTVLVVVRAGVRAWADPEGRRRFVRWTGLSVLAAAVAWFPPVYEQLTARNGNLTKIWEHFSDPPEEAIGLGRGARLLMIRLNPLGLLDRDLFAVRDGDVAVALGIALLVVWAASVLVAWRLRHRVLLRLDAVLVVGLGLGLLSAARIFGFLWYYLSLWAWGLAVLMFVAIGWTLAAALEARPGGAGPGLRRAGAVALVGVLALSLVSLTVDATDATAATNSNLRLVRVLGRLAPPTVEAIESGSVPGGGEDGRYLVSWADPIGVGAQGYGLLLELERQGLDVGAQPPHRAGTRPHRVLDPEDATAEVHLAVGQDVDVWRARPEAREVAFADPRTDAERAEYARQRRQVIDELRALGQDQLVPAVDANVITLATDLRVPPRLQRVLARMVGLGLPTAIFVAPPEAA